MNSNVSQIWSALVRQGKLALAWAEANWKWVVFLIWVGITAYFIAIRWPTIHWFALGDTDDNMRYLQVRDWLNGQGWYDLSQHRMNPPHGGNIHWSRIVDLPIAGLMLFFRLFVADGLADRLACAVAPMLPLLVLMLALAFITRRMASGPAWIVAALAPLGAPMGMSMYMPLRVDHHGWQLALVAIMLAGIVDRKWVRGGLVAGLASALSIAIGMEMMVYLAGAGGIIALRWVFKQGAGRRMLPYALALGGGTAACFLAFASYANRAMVCDAISPIWVATLGLASAAMVVLALLPLRHWGQRLALGAVAGAMVGGFLYLNWPQCLSAYQIPPELAAKWLVNIREAKPVMSEPFGKALSMLALPVAGALGALVACWFARRDSERLWAWGSVALMTLFALALTFWQIRAAPAAQLLAIPAASWALTAGAQFLLTAGLWGRVAGAVLVLGVLGIFNAGDVYGLYGKGVKQVKGEDRSPAALAKAKRDANRKEWLARIRKANGRCRTLPALSALNKLPPATILTMVDLGPRLIATTHHSAIAGPYHRNASAILDLHHAFDGPVEGFRTIARQHGATYFLYCPDFPEGTIYQTRSRKGFYADVVRGQMPAWLHPVDLGPAKLPYTLYRIDYAMPDGTKSAPVGKEVAQQGR